MRNLWMVLKMFRESFLTAIRSVVVNKMRTFLTLLGITIGIFAIISVFTALDWMETGIRDNIASLGEDVVYIDKFPWSNDPNLAWWNIIQWPVPTVQEYEIVKRRSTRAENVVFNVTATRDISYRNNRIENANILCVTHEYADLRYFELEEGRYFSPIESATGRNVAVIGADVASNLFREINPVGKEISIQGAKIRVIGIVRKEGSGGLGDQGLDKTVLIPLNYVRNLVNIRSDRLMPNIMVKPKPGVTKMEIDDELRSIMRSVRRLKPSAPDNFALNRASMITQALAPIFSGINLGGWIIGGFSILVGGFGIANIMFVSVKERTHIIGIQKALGAKRYFILLQFLYESILLSLVGGILGLLMIFIATLFINQSFDAHIHLTVGNILLGITISATVGVISGYAPARSASRLNPVEAISVSF